jgi:hypothetical protein
LVGATLSTSAAVPNEWSPYPLLQFFLITSGLPRWLNVIAGPLAFVLFNAHLVLRPYRGKLWYLAAAMAVLSLLTVVYLGWLAPAAIEHQGERHLAVMVLANALAVGFFWWGWIAWRTAFTTARALALNVLVFSWLFWFAFPYMGEGI